MYKALGAACPKRLKDYFSKQLAYCGIDIDPDKFLGFLITFGPAMALAVALDLNILLKVPIVLVFLVALLVFEATAVLWLSLAADAKGHFTERVLPDALRLMSTNVRAGLTIDKAMLLSARPEFGPFKTEIERTGRAVMAGQEIEGALAEIPTRIKSEVLARTMKLIVEGIKSGGQIAELLDQTATDLDSQRLTDQEVRASVMTYNIFILFAAGIGAPMLFGISSYLTQVLGAHAGSFEIGARASEFSRIPIGAVGTTLSTEFIVMFSVICLIVSSIFGALIIGLIKKGTEKAGVIFIPILLGLSLGIFFVVRTVFGNMFAAMLGP